MQEMTSRYLGLVVVPGEYITKIEVEEFESQVRGRVGPENTDGAGSGNGDHGAGSGADDGAGS